MALQVRRGTAAERGTITPAVGELCYDTDTKKLYVGDGSTLGGIAVDTAGSGIADGATLSTGLTFPLAGLKFLDTNASHAVTLTTSSNITADRAITFAIDDSSRTIDVSATNLTVTVAGNALTSAATADAQRAIIEAAAPSVVTINGTTNPTTTLTKATHQGKVIYCTTAALTLVVDGDTDFDAYASCEIVNKTGGVVSFTATATINRIGSKPLTLPANGRATLMREATADVYLLTGEMA
jgi:hypothetical protein